MKTPAKPLALLLPGLLLGMMLVGQTALAQQDERYSEAELAQMLAPIALYPDALLSQILMASTYPLEVVEAARWSRRNARLEGSDAVNAVMDQDWDPSVKSLVAFPRVLAHMSEELSWTQRLGDAFLLQEEDVAATIQDLRHRAQDAGNLDGQEHIRVVRDREVILIEPANPRVVYVPYYQPTVVYGGWWWPGYAPVYWGPPYGSYVSFGITWVSGVAVSQSFFYSSFNWHQRHVVILHSYDRHRHLGRGSPGVHRWRHDPWHRRGIAYRHPVVHQRYVTGRPAPDRRFTAYDNTATRDAQRRPDWQGRRDTTTSRDHAGPARLAPHASTRMQVRPETGRRAPEHRQERARTDSLYRTPTLGSAQTPSQDTWRQQRRSGGEITGQRRHEQRLQDRTRQGQVIDPRRSINSRDIPSSHSDRVRGNQAQGWREQARESQPSRRGATDPGRSQTRSTQGRERDWQGGRRDGNLNRQHGSQPGFGSRGEGRGGFSR